MTELERYKYDVLVIGAGGAGLRAAVEAREAGLRVAIICKSLFGKAHTVMAEGGAAASMGNVNDKDNWMVHFRDTMRGGKFLNHYKMAEIHAKEAPDRIYELEVWGALFDRTQEIIYLLDELAFEGKLPQIPVYVSDQMVGHKLGEFSATRNFRSHIKSDKKARR